MLFPHLFSFTFLYYPVQSLVNTTRNVMEFINKRYGKWLIIAYVGIDANRHKIYKTRCDCGTEKENRLYALTRGVSTQCKSCKMRPHLDNAENFIGKRFGNWLVSEKVKNESINRWCYKCTCRCGTISDIYGSHLKKGLSTKCQRCRRKTHGMSRTTTFDIWTGMMSRCHNEKRRTFKNYGGRGIKVCERWFKFENFLEDMGERPEGLQIDRINNDGNYEPNNCRWVTPKVNNANRKRRTLKKGI